MDWLNEFIAKIEFADHGDELSRTLNELKTGSLEDWTTKALAWIETASRVRWTSDAPRAEFDAMARPALAAASTDPVEVAWRLEVLAGIVRKDAHSHVAGRTEPERRYALIDSVRRVPEGYVATSDGMEADFGFPHGEMKALIEWAVSREMVKQRGNQITLTSHGREWLGEEVARLASAKRAQQSLSVSDWTLDLTFVSDAAVREVLVAKVAELAIAQAAQLPMASVVLAGAISEGVLYDALAARKAIAMASPKAPKVKGSKTTVKDITSDAYEDEWALRDLIDVARDIKVLGENTGRMANEVLRDFRNMIHPKKQAKSGRRPGVPEMKACIAWLEALVRDVATAP